MKKAGKVVEESGREPGTPTAPAGDVPGAQVSW